MSLPPLAALPAPLLPLAERAAALLPAAWPAERTEALRRSCALSDFVHEQAVRDSQLLAELGASGDLERRFAAGELHGQLQALLAVLAPGHLETIAAQLIVHVGAQHRVIFDGQDTG